MMQRVASEGFGKWADKNTFYGFGENTEKKMEFIDA